MTDDPRLGGAGADPASPLHRLVADCLASDARPCAAPAPAEVVPRATAMPGLGRIVTLYHRASTSHHIHEYIRRLYF
jgi:hypothetical protein